MTAPDHRWVWAPAAEAVRLHAGPQTARASGDLVRGDAGWWLGPALPPNTDYAFEVDGRGPFPDPRSPRQPSGVHDFSRTFDAGAFAWTDDAWGGRDARGAVTYELHVGTFTIQGTLDAAADGLGDLARSGIEMVELMPIQPFPGRHGWGYDGVGPYGVHEPYGGPEALQRFVDRAHKKGLGVTLDVVYNHLGPSGNYLGQFGPYFTDAHHTPWGEAINLDQDGSDEVRRYLTEAALRWFRDFHVDALRLDAVHELKDDSETHWLRELSDATAALSAELGRPLSLVAESDLNDERMVDADGLAMTAQWNDDFHHALHAYLTGERHGYYVDFGSVEALDKVVRDVFWHNGTYSPFRGTAWGAPVSPDTDRRRFVVCASNHDQVGNRALGDRPSVTLSPGAQATALAFVMLGPFTPMIFMGEEYGETRPFLFFTDHDDPDLADAVSEGRRREFAGHGWEELYGRAVVVPDPQDPDTFRRSKLGPGLAATGAVPEMIRAWFASLVDARQVSQRQIAQRLRDAAGARHEFGVSELAPRVLRLDGPVPVLANLSDSPLTVDGAPPVATFGDVSLDRDETDAVITLAPDAVVLESRN